VLIFAVELRPHFGCAVDTEVLAVNPFDHRPQLCVANSACRRSSLLGCPIRTRGELQRSADRLDPESFAMGIDVGDHFLVRPSSSVAKIIDADFKISFARRSSLTSRSSSFTRSRSSLANPGRWPASVSAFRTQIRNDS
jgi:hypothetical protein